MKKITASFFALLLVASAGILYLKTIHNNISSNVIRMHIVANSNSISDQSVKLKIRDKILENYSFAAKGIREEKEYIETNIEKINKDVNNWLKEENKSYGAKAHLSKSYFPTKKYGGLSLPKGEYTAFKIVLGEGKGENWWCVMFPPLCFADSSVGTIDEKSDEYLKANLSGDEYKLVTSDGTKIKFRLLEFINSF